MLKTKQIPFNKPFFLGTEHAYIQEALEYGQISGNGLFTKKCHQFFQDHYGFNKVLLTTSCTDALEMSAILANISPGDEVIIPSYTFPSTANAFVLRGANIVFADSSHNHPNLDSGKIPSLITEKTKAIVPVHYAGVACDMAQLIQLAKEYNLIIIEDAAQAVDSYFQKEPLGKIGHLGTFSFHETKNLSSGEGGLLAINDPKFAKRAEIIWEKGTNRAAFFRGEVQKYSWVDIGSSFLPSDVIAALLYAQLESLNKIQVKRKKIWDQYNEGLQSLSEKGYFSLPFLPKYATNNAHIFYLICSSLEERTALIHFLKECGIAAIFHYLPLHTSDYYRSKGRRQHLPYAEMYSNCLLRLPLYAGLQENDVSYIIERITDFFEYGKH